jgi:hypothetical protein
MPLLAHHAVALELHAHRALGLQARRSEVALPVGKERAVIEVHAAGAMTGSQ